MSNCIRANIRDLFDKDLSREQLNNKRLNIAEFEANSCNLKSYPRRVVLELTNMCNISCIMCGRNYSKFNVQHLDMFAVGWLRPILHYAEEVTLMGWGEPTLHPQFEEILKILDTTPVCKYLCTNGQNLESHLDSIFEYNINVIAFSVNGSTSQTNDFIRRGSSLSIIENVIKKIVDRRSDSTNPYLCFVFCLMKSNYDELEGIIDLAHQLNVQKVKVVHFTSFSRDLEHESLWGYSSKLNDLFDRVKVIAIQYGVELELPYLEGEDPAGDDLHKPCYACWRDLFVGSDGYIRPCMSTNIKLAKLSLSESPNSLWNSPMLVKHREIVNNNNLMPKSCRTCYQSTFCNWNKATSYHQTNIQFAPEWGE